MNSQPNENLRQIGRGIAGAVLLAVVWELAARGLNLPAYVLPSVSSILAGIVSDAGNLLDATAFTAGEALAGYVIGCGIGMSLAVLVTIIPAAR